MSRYVQPAAAPAHPYTDDHVLRSHLDRILDPARRASAGARLTALGDAVETSLRGAHADAEEHPPVLRRYDAWGARIDRVETAQGWQAQRRAAAEHAVVALPYLPAARRLRPRRAQRPARAPARVRAGIGDVLLPGRDERRRGGAAERR